MDIAKITPKNFPLKITDPATGKYVGLTVELAPMSDPRFKEVERAIADRAQLKRVRGKIVKSEEREANELDLLAAVVVNFAWENDADGKPGNFGGEQLPFTEPNVMKLLSVEWLKGQIEDGLTEQSNFFKH